MTPDVALDSGAQQRLDPVMHGACSPQSSYSVLFPSLLQCSRPSCAFHSPHSFHYQKPATPTPFTHFNRPPTSLPGNHQFVPCVCGSDSAFHLFSFALNKWVSPECPAQLFRGSHESHQLPWLPYISHALPSTPCS